MVRAEEKVLIIGLARSGFASAVVLAKRGFKVTVTDIASRGELKDADLLEDLGVKLVLGGHPPTLLDSCDTVVVSPGVPGNIAILEEARNRGIPIISELELGFRLTNTPIIAITGTNGKTTTTSIIGEILKNDGKNVAVVGNIGAPLVEEVGENANRDYLVVEVSSFQLENIESFRPKISVLINLSEDHLNRHKTLKNYFEIKARIMENQGDGDYTVLNYDDTNVFSLARKAKGKIVFFSLKDELPCGIYVKNDVIVIRVNGNIYPILKTAELGIKGQHNLENALAAVCVAWITHSNLNTLAETLKGFRGVEHRLEHVATVDGVTYINDSKGTNPIASQKAIEAINEPIVLIAGGYNKNSDYTTWIKAFKGKVKEVVLIGETASAIEKAAYEVGFKKAKRVFSMDEAVLLASLKASPGDVVLLSPACASWDMFKDYEERGRAFKDKVYSLRRICKNNLE